MKEREKEIAKSGGFTQLFNDDKDPSIHIQQLKTKYAAMRKKMEDEVLKLNDKKRDVTGCNVSLKAKLSNLQNLEQGIYNKLKNLQDSSDNKIRSLTSEFLKKNNERNEFEAGYRLDNSRLKSEKSRNEDLEYDICSNKKLAEMKQSEFDEMIQMMQDLTDKKLEMMEDNNEKIKEILAKTEAEVIYQSELEKNKQYKEKIKDLESKLVELNNQCDCDEVVNEFLIKKKNDVMAERRKYIDLNVELKHEIDAKNQLNEVRIQKKMKDLNSEEIQKMQEHLDETNKKIVDLNEKIEKEQVKIRQFNKDIIRLKIQKRNLDETNAETVKHIEETTNELKELKTKNDDMDAENETLKAKIGKEKTDNELLRNRNKNLNQEFAALSSKFDFISNNYDYTTNLKKISIEELKTLAETNTMVNSTIEQFADKVGPFKRKNVKFEIFE